MDNLAVLQIKIYTRKFFRTLKKESIISIIMGVVITLLVMLVTKENMFDSFEGTKLGLFALICVCIWVGIFNSIQLVCREKNDIVKDELDKSLRASSYIASHFIYQLCLCFIQSVIVFVIFMIFMKDKGDIGQPVLYLITIFLVMFSSDAMALVISSVVPNPIIAMTIMPLLLLIQLVMADVLIELDESAAFISNFTISKWGMAAFGNIGSITNLDSRLAGYFSDLPYTPDLISSDDMELYGDTSVALCWLCFITFIVVFYFVSVFALKMTTKKIKK